MRITVFIAYASIFVWLLPVYKQYGTKYFHFALINAIAGPSMILLGHFFNNHQNYFIPGFCMLQLASIVFNPKKYAIAILAAIMLIMLPIIKPSTGMIFGITLFINFMIFLIILYALFDIFIKKQSLNLFLALLFVYMAIDIVKIFDVAVNLGEGYIYYSIGEAAQFLFALSFMFINYDTKNFKLRIRALEENDAK